MQNLCSFNRLKTCKSPNQRLLLQHVQTNLAIEIERMFLILETTQSFRTTTNGPQSEIVVNQSLTMSCLSISLPDCLISVGKIMENLY